MELATDQESELRELTHIYIGRGLTPNLAHLVAVQLTEHDALGTHARDELGITEVVSANPLQAALTSAAAFSVGALLPLLATLFTPSDKTIAVVAIISLLSLGGLGGIAAKVGGAKVYVGIARVTFWGVLAMTSTALIGRLFGVMTS